VKTELLAALRAAFHDRRDVRLAILFGSQARDRPRPDSDVDLAVVGPVDRLRLATELSLALDRDVDVVNLRSAGYPLLKALLRDGIVVHEAERGAAADWRTRTITQVELDRPWFERMRDAYLDRLAAGIDG
jgi:predicted nucleotidyltransferase